MLSTENLRRSPRELSGIFAAIEAKLGRLAEDRRIRRHAVRVRAVGKLELLPDATLAAIRAAEAATADQRGIYVRRQQWSPLVPSLRPREDRAQAYRPIAEDVGQGASRYDLAIMARGA